MPTRPRKHNPHGAPSRRTTDRAYEQRRAADPQLAEAKRLRNSGRWQRFRARFKRRFPICHPCEREGRTTLTQAVHHIRAIGTDPELAFREDNCLPVCNRCHMRIEQAERRGEDTSAWFAAWQREREDDACNPFR